MRIFSLLLIFNALLTIPLFAQDSHEETFDDNVLNGWTSDAMYTLTEENQELKVEVAKTGQWETFNYTFPSLDLSFKPFVKLKVKSASTLVIRIDLRDETGKVTNKTALSRSVTGNNQYQEFEFEFAGIFYQQYPEDQAGPVDQTKIVGMNITINPGSTYTGTLFIDDLQVGGATGIAPPSGRIALNQVGFYPDEKKVAIVTDTASGPFYIVEATTQDTVYTGELGSLMSWSHTGEFLRRADFSDFTGTGTFRVLAPETGLSYPFEVKDEVHFDVMKAILKSYYYQRASIPLEAQYAGDWARDAGHPDQNVYVHPSAATANRPAESLFPNTGGWYDAGDYGKYVVNSGIATYQILALYEHYPSYYDTLDLNIPESNNTLPDILDEALYNVRWMMKMQDPDDGGVFHKTTAERHDNTVMPSSANLKRYVFKKSTQATLDFAAVMAQGYRIFKDFPTELPELADSLIIAAEKAYLWAETNPNDHFSNPITANNLGQVSSGEYGDGSSADEFAWARVELLLATGKDKYYISSDISNISVPGWQNVRALGLISLIQNKNYTENRFSINTLENRINSATYSMLNGYNNSAYAVPMGAESWNFNWGSNGFAGNQGVLLLQNYRLTGIESYFDAALANLDYVLGRNGTDYSFVTGHGDNTPMYIHHRPSEADKVPNPVPGLVSGGPFGGAKVDNCTGYPSFVTGRSYLDSYCSYTTNENAINYSSSVVYLAGAIEAIKKGASYFPTGLTKKDISSTIKNAHLFPNPASDIISIRFMESGKTTIELCDLAGVSVLTKDLNTSVGESLSLDVSGLKTGMYLVKINIEGISSTEKIIIQ